MLCILVALCLIFSVATDASAATSGPTARPTSEQIKKVASELVCLCGTCNRESLATCVCSAFAIPERVVIGDMLAAGNSPDQIVASYVERFGNVALAEPPPGGVRWVSLLTPLIALIAGVLVVRAVLLRWRRDESRLTPPSSSAQPSKYHAQLQDELRRLDRE